MKFRNLVLYTSSVLLTGIINVSFADLHWVSGTIYNLCKNTLGKGIKCVVTQNHYSNPSVSNYIGASQQGGYQGMYDDSQAYIFEFICNVPGTKLSSGKEFYCGLGYAPGPNGKPQPYVITNQNELGSCTFSTSRTGPKFDVVDLLFKACPPDSAAKK